MDGHASIDEQHMRRALALAMQGQGFVEPNPMVGAVITDPDGNIVGEGFHERFGSAHAEVNALASAGQEAHGGTLYVTLEPCCHHGKTPPCTDALLRSGIRRVVAAMADPFPQVGGGGLKRLRDAGIEVHVGICDAEARSLNAPYLHRLRTGRPWVIAKWAMSLDGKIATRTGESQWISNRASRLKVHELRGRVDAILVGRGTVISDDPLLTARPPGPRTATRVVLTKSGDLPADCQLRRTAAHWPTLVYTTMEGASRLEAWQRDGVELVVTTGLEATLADLGSRGMTNILVEGGAGVLGAFHDASLIDEAWIFVAPLLIGSQVATSPVGGKGIASLGDTSRFTDVHVESLEGDVFIRARRALSDRP